MKEMRPRPRATGKQNPAKIGFRSPTPPQEANARQLVPQQLSSAQQSKTAAGPKTMKARSFAAKRMMR